MKTIDPLDLQESIGVGTAIPFNAKGVFRITYQTREAIKYNIVNLILTGQTERYLNLSTGFIGLNNILFENINSDGILEVLKDRIKTTIETLYPMVTVQEILFDFKETDNKLELHLVYNISTSEVEDDILINIEIQ